MKQSKINRLPDSVQMILNGRIENNEAGAGILKWLNGLPEVKEVLDLHFGGAAVSKQNLSAWRRTGFPLWQAREGMVDHAYELAKFGGEIKAPEVVGHLFAAVSALLAGLVLTWKGEASPEFERRLKVLRALTREVTAVQRGVCQLARLKLDLKERKRSAGSGGLGGLGGSDLLGMFREIVERRREAEEAVKNEPDTGGDGMGTGTGNGGNRGEDHHEDAKAETGETGKNDEAVKDSQGCQGSEQAGPAGDTEGGHRLTPMDTDKAGGDGINAKTQRREGAKGAEEGLIYEGGQGW